MLLDTANSRSQSRLAVPDGSLDTRGINRDGVLTTYPMPFRAAWREQPADVCIGPIA
jgi:hypothetical protein